MTTPVTTYRTKSIVISLPKPDTYSWIEFVLQKLIIDRDTGDHLQLIDDVERYNKRTDQVYTQMVTFVDPVTKQEHTISVGGIAASVKQAIIMWATEDGSKVYIPEHDSIVDITTEV